LIVRTEFGGRELTEVEQQKALPVYAPWMQRLTRFASETCLSEGDLIRLTYADIDEARGVVRPAGGRKKTNGVQISPLTAKARAVFDEIKAATRSGAIVPNVNGLVFTLDNGKPVTKGLINYQVERAIKAGVAKFRFHDYRHTALTRWAREKIHVDVAMVAAGHSSVQMHQRYTHLQDKDIAAAFDCGKNVVTHSVTRRRIARRK
jgi:integrase